MHKNLLKTLSLAAPLCFASVAHAIGNVVITNITYGNITDPTLQGQIKTMFNNLAAQMTQQVQKNLSNVDPTTYLNGSANAAALSQAGVGTDYAIPFDFATIGATVAVAGDLGDNSLSDVIRGNIKANQISGFAAQTGVVVGFNPGKVFHQKWWIIDPNRMRIYLSYMNYHYNHDQVTVGFSEMGFRVKYNIMHDRRWAFGLVKWGGLDVGTGYQRSTMSVDASATVNASQSENLGAPYNAQVTADIVGNFIAGADVTTNTIPFEVSSYVRFLYFLSLYGGLGADLNFGSATGNASTDAPIAVNSGNPAIGTPTATASADIDGQQGGPSKLNLRYFGGVELDAAIVALFVQYNQSLTNSGLKGIDVGLRAYW